ncbi:BnaCnng44110D [Brassica napus]|uniref:BnaCnng44110D protein n=1 Tax=Brassica napus TaxID=3708 RepID=A0A078JDR7_BRANA|nr:BnaCnng44110D [Brassica napus]
MLGLSHKDDHSSSGFWSSDVDGVSYKQLDKFWSELSPRARQELLRIDRQALFEQARKSMCCSRCNSLLLECFLQIVSQGSSKSSPKDQTFLSRNFCNTSAVSQWGGLTAARDGSLTVLDCYLYAKSFKALQTVFESARVRERERELLYPDACGGDGRVWISQGYGKGYGTRDSCALHTTWLSCETLVDFWSALEDESRLSLFTMKEEDFIDRLTSRFFSLCFSVTMCLDMIWFLHLVACITELFDCKKFCRDCRKNVIREFKSLKELKRMQRKPQCTEWFCAADTAFQYQVGSNSVRADWSQHFTENAGYHQFEWAIGTEKGETDILEFKRVGSNRSAQASGLDLHGLKECYITLRAFKKNGRSSEISVKAHALGCQQCVHSRLVVGDGFVTIKRGKCIRMFFEHAEEVEEEENDVAMDKDGNELDGECFRPQKHAKSPELAREFLLDAAMVIFKEQVEKAFRDGTARQNAHIIFICLSSKLLEQRVHVACKEIITLEKQNKLLEEEEKEKREEEERKERKRTKEREKKLRRKERLKEKEQKNPKFIDKEREKRAEGSMNLDEESNNTINCEDTGIETGDVELSSPGTPDDQDGECLDGCITSTAETHYSDSTDKEIIDQEKIIDHENGCRTNDSPGPVHQTEILWIERSSRHPNGSNKNLRVKASKAGGKPNSIRSHQGFQCSDKRNGERYDDHSCSYKPSNGYWEKAESNISSARGMPVTVRKVLDSTQLKHPLNSSHSDAEEVVDVSSSVKLADTQSECNASEKLGSDCSRFSGNYINRIEEDKKMEVHLISKNDDMYSKDPIMSRSSSSDNCSSCLSEGDSNTSSSNSRNTVSSPMSDLEEKLVDNEMHDCHEKMIEKETEKSTDERDLLRIKKMSNHPAENEESKLSETPSTVLSQSTDNTVPSVITGSYLSQPQSMMFPQMLNQSIPLPVFQSPATMGYYHQAPWSAAPANGLMPFPHPNHYVYAGTLGYNLNGDSPLCLQYGTPLNHSATPFYNSGPAPLFHPFGEINTMNNTVEQVQTLEPLEHGYLKEAADERKINRIGEDFSLFHFGGPVALSTASRSNPANPKDGVLGDFSLQFSGDHVFGDINKKKKERTVGDEYNLFAESNCLRFSLF